MVKIFQRNNWSSSYIYKDDMGIPINITGYTYTFLVKKYDDNYINDSKAIIKKSVLITSGATGGFTVNLDTLDTDIKPGKYVYQVQLFNENILTGDIDLYTIHQDDFIVLKNYQMEI